MSSVIDKIGNKFTEWDQNAKANEAQRKERLEIEKGIETLLYNELKIVVNQGRIDSKKVEQIALLKDLVKSFKEPTEIQVECKGSS